MNKRTQKLGAVVCALLWLFCLIAPGLSHAQPFPAMGIPKQIRELPSPTEDEPEPTALEQFYSEAPGFCEPIEYPSCETDEDCSIVETNDEVVCRKNHCVEKFAGKDVARARSKEVRRIARKLGASNRVARLLSMVSIRESLSDPTERHRMDADFRANRRSYKKFFGVYQAAENEALDDRDRWIHGLGLFGHNVSLHVKRFDPAAPPEILCDRWVAVALYLRSLQRARKAYMGTLPLGQRRVFCDGARYRGGVRSHSERPSLYDLHGMASAGRACPKGPEHRSTQSFESRARRNGLDPYYIPKRSELGYELSSLEILELRNEDRS